MLVSASRGRPVLLSPAACVTLFLPHLCTARSSAASEYSDPPGRDASPVAPHHPLGHRRPVPANCRPVSAPLYHCSPICYPHPDALPPPAAAVATSRNVGRCGSGRGASAVDRREVDIAAVVLVICVPSLPLSPRARLNHGRPSRHDESLNHRQTSRGDESLRAGVVPAAAATRS